MHIAIQMDFKKVFVLVLHMGQFAAIGRSNAVAVVIQKNDGVVASEIGVMGRQQFRHGGAGATLLACQYLDGTGKTEQREVDRLDGIQHMGFHRLGVVFSLAANSMFAFVVAGAELGNDDGDSQYCHQKQASQQASPEFQIAGRPWIVAQFRQVISGKGFVALRNVTNAIYTEFLFRSHGIFSLLGSVACGFCGYGLL
ncbi:hypothetical protein ACFFKC_06020 [Pseudoduganella danionis]|uniref:hypothetical protein n=1 Tax=Pseudoduganella danionis TaxID=1890295 RepID=UPI001E32D1B0|nr:hypothetical protein [Pseudoduganella danionis]